MCRLCVIIGLVLIASVACVTPAFAQSIGMPAGARQWIKMNSNDTSDAAGVGSIPDPSPNYVTDPARLAQGYRAYANADTQANRLRIAEAHRFVFNVFFYNSMYDTYTISGPPGTEGTPVVARVVMHATGTLFVSTTINIGGGLHVGPSSAAIEVGTWNGSTDPAFNEGGRVIYFGPGFSTGAGIPSANYGTFTPTLDINLLIDQPLTRTVGTPFDVAFGFQHQGNGAGNLLEVPSPADDGYIVATIDWELPAGYTITSVLGWTDPNAPPLPTVADQPDNAAVCVGGAAAMSVTAGGAPPFSYQWRKNASTLSNGVTGSGSTISGADSLTLMISDVAVADADVYDCVITNAGGSVTSNAATLAVFASGGGDGDASGTTDGNDIAGCVNVLLFGGIPSAPYCAYDMNGDGVVSLDDAPLFVDVLVGM